jgi:HAMP domain-containing protein
VESQPQLPEPPSLDFDSLDTSSLIDQFCKYYTKLMDYRVGQIELKLKAETTDLQKRLSETVTELESTKSSLRKVKEIAKTRVTQLATEVAELTERLNKEKQLEEEIIAERDEYKRKLEELRKLPSGPVRLVPSAETDAISPRGSMPVVTLPRAVSNLSSTKSPREPLARSKSVYVKRELGELEQLMAELVSPICPICKQPVLDSPIQAFGKQYHPEHFCCSRCSLELVPGDTFEETDDFRILCGNCLEKERTPYCNNCRNPIVSGQQSFLDDAKNSYCATCAQAVTDSMVLICKSCKGPIEGDCVNALGSKWHPACFLCPTCGLDLTQSDFYDVNGFPYCDLHGH